VVVVVVIITIVLDRCAECVLEDLGQDIFHVYWDITKGVFFVNLESGDDDGELGNGERTRKWRRSRRLL
jgi:hypothetical protein